MQDASRARSNHHPSRKRAGACLTKACWCLPCVASAMLAAAYRRPRQPQAQTQVAPSNPPRSSPLTPPNRRRRRWRRRSPAPRRRPRTPAKAAPALAQWRRGRRAAAAPAAASEARGRATRRAAAAPASTPARPSSYLASRHRWETLCPSWSSSLSSPLELSPHPLPCAAVQGRVRPLRPVCRKTDWRKPAIARAQRLRRSPRTPSSVSYCSTRARRGPLQRIAPPHPAGPPPSVHPTLRPTEPPLASCQTPAA